MNGSVRKLFQKLFLPALAILLVIVLAIYFWKLCIPKPSAPIEEVTEAVREEPVKRAKIVLRSSLPGRWYPADAETLTKQIKAFFQNAQVQPIKDVIAFILPHAGYQFSGQTAAYGLKTADRQYKRVVIIGPSHRVPMENVLTVPRVTHYETPLGGIPLDPEFIDKLLKYSIFQNIPHVHEYEHSVQIELPLLQYMQQDKVKCEAFGSLGWHNMSR